MWQKLPTHAIAEADAEEWRRRRRLGPPLLLAGGFAIALTALSALGFRGGSVRTGQVLLGDRLGLDEPGLYVIFVFTFGITFFLACRRRRAGRAFFGDAPVVICSKCQDVADEGTSSRCACGGSWEPIHHWGWVEESPVEDASQHGVEASDAGAARTSSGSIDSVDGPSGPSAPQSREAG